MFAVLMRKENEDLTKNFFSLVCLFLYLFIKLFIFSFTFWIRHVVLESRIGDVAINISGWISQEMAYGSKEGLQHWESADRNFFSTISLQPIYLSRVPPSYKQGGNSLRHTTCLPNIISVFIMPRARDGE